VPCVFVPLRVLVTAEATDPLIANSLLANVSSTLSPTQADLRDKPLVPDHDECFVALNGMARLQVALVGRSTLGILCKIERG